MKKILVRGGKALKGELAIGGAKNAALPILAASLLCRNGVSKIYNIPDLLDIEYMGSLIKTFGVKTKVCGEESLEFGSKKRFIEIEAITIEKHIASDEIVSKMRASVLVLAPLLARCGVAKISLPGGCAIGKRPVDWHLQVLEKMGAKITLSDEYINAEIPNRKHFRACEFEFPGISVGATETAIMAAVLAEGKTVLKNAAQEPEIVDMCEYLNKCGAKISGYGTSTITIEGVLKLQGTSHEVIPDRIEAGTYAIAAAISCGDIILKNINPKHIASVISKLRDMGLEVTIIDDNTARFKHIKPLSAVGLVTKPYPDFPTDLQATLMALNTVATGEAIFEETIFENRFKHVPQLMRMGAKIEELSINKVRITGVGNLSSAHTIATDLRASAALVLAAIAASGESVVSDVEHLFRGYGNVIAKIKSLGGDIQIA